MPTGDSVSALAELGKWFSQAAVVGLGWYVVHRFSVQRDRDKSRRELVVKSADGLLDAVDKVLVEARTYHLSDKRDVSAELRIKMALQDLAMRANYLHEVCNNRADLVRVRTAFTRLRKTVTGLHFEDEHTGSISEGDSQLQDIADAIMEAKRALMIFRLRQFPKDNREEDEQA